jgi:hypothetical protein
LKPLAARFIRLIEPNPIRTVHFCWKNVLETSIPSFAGEARLCYVWSCRSSTAFPTSTRSLMQTDGGWMVTCNRDMEVVSNAQKVFHFTHESPILHSQWTASSSVIGSDAQQQNSSWVMRFHFVHLRRRRPAGKQNCSGCLCVTPASQTSRNGNILLRKQFKKGGEE